jgi:hypothetical protein
VKGHAGHGTWSDGSDNTALLGDVFERQAILLELDDVVACLHVGYEEPAVA